MPHLLNASDDLITVHPYLNDDLLGISNISNGEQGCCWERIEYVDREKTLHHYDIIKKKSIYFFLFVFFLTFLFFLLIAASEAF